MRWRLTFGLCGVVLLGAAIAAVALAGRSSDDPFGSTCGGCSSEVRVFVPDLPYAAKRIATVEVCIAGECRSDERAWMRHYFEGQVLGSAPVLVRARLRAADGTVLARSRLRVIRRRVDSGCGICWTGAARVEPDGRLVAHSLRRRMPPPGRPGVHLITRGRVTRLEAGRRVPRLTIGRDQPIEIRTDSRSAVRLYVSGRLPPEGDDPFERAFDKDGRVWKIWAPYRLRGERELTIRLDHRADGRIVRFRLPIRVP